MELRLLALPLGCGQGQLRPWWTCSNVGVSETSWLADMGTGWED